MGERISLGALAVLGHGRRIDVQFGGDVVGAVACCEGLKLIGGAIPFSGLAATIGLTTGQTTFVVGDAGLLFAVQVLRYQRAGSAESLT